VGEIELGKEKGKGGVIVLVCGQESLVPKLMKREGGNPQQSGIAVGPCEAPESAKVLLLLLARSPPFPIYFSFPDQTASGHLFHYYYSSPRSGLLT
jgi:hypothetical protein